MKMLIKNAIIVSNGKKEKEAKDIFIKNGTIKKIEKNLEEQADEILDAKGMLVLPGFIDLNCKICEAGYENKNNILFISKSGAKGGFTTITTSSSTQPIVDNKTVVEYILSKTKEKNIINIYPYASMTKEGKGKEIAELGEMILAGAVALSDGGMCIENTALLRDIFIYSNMLNVTLITHPIEPSLVKGGVVHYGYMSTKLGLSGIPREAEEIEISKNIILAKHTGAKLHISSVTTKGAVELIRDAKKQGTKITCGTCPHYFALTEKYIENYNTFAKVMPPLRTEDDVLAIKEGLKDGTIDAISSGHTPVLEERKITEFESADFGISGLEVCFPITNTKLVKEEKFKIEDLTILMSKNPANILGFKNKGEIKEGFVADIIFINPNKIKPIKSAEFYS
ncbi:MAG: dihydroorotase, partial [Eubacteriales bacterium]|nr:dihydroorotase [Eubacteriales bacterium]